ncbi:hypothetical protein BX661DRAFT_131885, partial [Kickxella alabastrina]|uniref:uncharacterized protein n=1 Tax=Kickxella alabastrina TaxID=61397 RepID=UPI002220AAF1
NVCEVNLTYQLTNIFQTGNHLFQYDSCHVDTSGSSISSGIVNFNTRSGDTWDVISAYHDAKNEINDFSIYGNALQEKAASNSGSISGLEGFCDAWKASVKDVLFRNAQDLLFNNLYVLPSQLEANKLGIQHSVSMAALYDTGVSLGA